ncbi:MAG: hydantoinase B/oxoprolinase family protein [Deltaproteobacteria bacterium]
MHDARAAAAIGIWQSRFSGVCDEMGAALRRAAYSPNVKEREDYSCALFAADGELIGQAEHIPVHLGSMAASVRSAIEAFGDLAEGDQVLVNDPFCGGTHLNDITFVAAVRGQDGALLGYVANRAHHADVGGSVPGSLSATAVDSVAEGLCLPPIRAVRGGAWDGDIRALLLANTRTPEERAGDLDAQWGANRLGARRLGELAAKHGRESLAWAMRLVCDYAEQAMRVELHAASKGLAAELSCEDFLEAADGSLVPIRVVVRIDEGGMEADFRGTGRARPGVPSGVRAVTQACLEFAARSITSGDIPRNGGAARVLRLRTEPGSVVDARAPVPVGAGNVEASQRIADVLLAALAPAFPTRIGAASQGTMNNLLIGSVPGPGQPFVYYETIGGGQGGRPGQAGQSGIHTGMTNTANTPIEALEHAYPLRVEAYRLRSGSGGAGEHPGGEGIERIVRLLEDSQVTLLAGRRAMGPRGLAGGAAGAPGEDRIRTPEGVERVWQPLSTQQLPAGTQLVLRTPGGGGYGGLESAAPATVGASSKNAVKAVGDPE